MAELFTETIVISITRAVKTRAVPSSIVTSDTLSALEAVMAELLGASAIVEIEVA